MPAPIPKSAKALSPTLLPAGRLSAWLSETRILSENPFLEGGERLFIGAREKALREWYAEMAEARKHDLLVGATSLLEASGWLPFPLCSLRTERAVTRLVHFHYERGLPQRPPERGDASEDRPQQKRLARALRTSGVRGRFAWRRFRSQWERLPWPLLWIDAGPVPSAPVSSKREGSGESPDGLLSAGALLEAEWYVRYMEKTGRSGSGGVKTENRSGSENSGSRLGGPSDTCPEGAPETSSLKDRDSEEDNLNEGGPEEGRPESVSIEASDANEKGGEKTGSEERLW